MRWVWSWTQRSRSPTFLVNRRGVGLQRQFCSSRCDSQAGRQLPGFGCLEAPRFVQSLSAMPKSGLGRPLMENHPPKGRSGGDPTRTTLVFESLLFPFLPRLDLGWTLTACAGFFGPDINC